KTLANETREPEESERVAIAVRPLVEVALPVPQARTPSPVNLNVNVVVPVAPLVDVVTTQKVAQVEEPTARAWTSLENTAIEPVTL
ncbi:hypothetical protein NL529_30920, partial [Klebsiella pneumoniae]|nr:hypothetical protein [Klebsiella pneumoniae]